MRRPSLPDLVAISVTALLAFGAPVQLTQSDGDLFAHIAFGREIVANGQIPVTSLFGSAPIESPFVAPAWAGALLFALLDRLGGLALVATFTAALAGATHGLLAAYLRKKSVPAGAVAVTSLIGMVIVASHWLARPHAFTLAASAVTLVVLEHGGRYRTVLLPSLFALWANLHGGWAFGLIIVGCYVVGQLVETARRPSPNTGTHPRAGRATTFSLVVAFILSIVATLATPYGLQLHRAVLTTLTDPGVAGVIDEYRPPSFSDPVDAFFLLLLLASVGLLVRSRRRLPASHILVIAACSLFALKAGRNISLFGVVAWPLVTLHLAPAFARWFRHSSAASDLARYDARLRVGWWSAPSLAIVLGIGALHGTVGPLQLVRDTVDPQRFPVVAVRHMQSAHDQSSLLTTWTWSGYVPFAWPGRRSYFDPLVFTPGTLKSFGTMLLAQSGWRDLLDAHAIDVVVGPPRLPLIDSLGSSHNWTAQYRDSTAVVMRRVPTP